LQERLSGAGVAIRGDDMLAWRRIVSVVVLDLDDAYPGNDRMQLLSELKQQVPGLKVTLFAIPGRCTREWVAGMPPWVELVPHGWMHETNRECERWDMLDAYTAMETALLVGVSTHGFKAPGWQISIETYLELQRRDYWVMDQPYNNHRRPPGLRSFILGEPPPGVVQIHGHVGHLNGRNANELEYLVPEILRYRDAEWKFVSEVVR
jgi:hypothetical protein